MVIAIDVIYYYIIKYIIIKNRKKILIIQVHVQCNPKDYILYY